MQLTAEVCCLLRHDVSLLVFLVVGLPCCRDVFLVVKGFLIVGLVKIASLDSCSTNRGLRRYLQDTTLRYVSLVS